MRNVHTLAAILALSACMPADDSIGTSNEQSALVSASLVVPPGPVPVPMMGSASAALTPGQILCDSYRASVGDEDDEDDGPLTSADIAKQCTRTASEFYKEMQVQLTHLCSPSTLHEAMKTISSKTTYLFPDGSYTQGAAAFQSERPKLFDSQAVTGMQNKFIYKPIDKYTVIAIGDPSYTHASGGTTDSVQYHVYTRTHNGNGSCRSLSKPSGKVCWTEVAGQWVYKRPFSGVSLPHPIVATRSQIPTAPSYPLELEPARIVCDGSFRARSGDVQNCEQAAREFYKEIQFQVVTLTDPNTISSGLAALNEATTFVYPTGLVTEGLAALGATIPDLFGGTWAPAGIENKFLYKPIDADTVLFIGDPMFTARNYVTGATRTLESVQVSVYRRNGTPLGNCRSFTNPEGDVCWNELAEQWVYGQPVLGD